MAQVIVDAGPLVALLDRSEQHHDWTLDQLRRMEGPLLTCDAVLTEVCYLLATYPKAIQQLRQFFRQKVIVTATESESRLERSFELMQTYRNVPMSFADACLVGLVESRPGAAIFTLDRDFAIYRQHRRRIIPLIAPF